MPRTARTRMLVASGARARWVERAKGQDELITVGELAPIFTHVHHGPAQVSFESAAGGMRHGIGDRGDAERRRQDFAAQIAEALNLQEVRGDFDRLALAAPPRLLREIRERLSDQTRAKVRLEIPKDLSKQPNHALRRLLVKPELA